MDKIEEWLLTCCESREYLTKESDIQGNRPSVAIPVYVSVAVKPGSLRTCLIVESFVGSCDLWFHFVVALCVKMGELQRLQTVTTLLVTFILP